MDDSRQTLAMIAESCRKLAFWEELQILRLMRGDVEKQKKPSPVAAELGSVGDESAPPRT